MVSTVVPRKAPTPSRATALPITRTAPGTSRPTALAVDSASDLLQKTRTLEHTVSRLTGELEAAAAMRASLARDADAIAGLQRIMLLREHAALEAERALHMQSKKELRSEKMAWVKRDFSITQFQAKETLLEVRLDELEEQLALSKLNASDILDGLEGALEGVRAELLLARGMLKEAERTRDEAKVLLFLGSSRQYISGRYARRGRRTRLSARQLGGANEFSTHCRYLPSFMRSTCLIYRQMLRVPAKGSQPPSQSPRRSRPTSRASRCCTRARRRNSRTCNADATTRRKSAVR
jgi:hypothetical protein